MDIAAMSVGLSQAKAMQTVSTSVTKKAMNVAEVQMQGIVDMMQSSAPNFGHRLNLSV